MNRQKLLKRISKIFGILFGVLLLFSGCGKHQENIHILRFEQLLFADRDPENLYADLKKNEQEYRFFFDIPLEDSLYLEDLKDIAGDTLLREINDTVQKYYSNLSWLEKDMGKAVGNIKKYFPDYNVSNYYTLIAAEFEGYFNRILVTDSFLAISIDMYTVDYFRKYAYFDLPVYMAAMLNKDEILPDCMAAIGYYFLGNNEKSESLLDIMITRGKILYFMDKVIPDVQDYLKIRYTKEQMDWCGANESLIWSYLLEKELLYETDFLKIRHLINEGPSTQGFDGAPARLGEYIGWQIVRKHMSKNLVTLADLFAQADAQKILSNSGYKPKRR